MNGNSIHVASAAAFPTEAKARDELRELVGRTAYRGVWQLPEPYGAVVHVFTESEPQWLEASGWRAAKLI